MGRIIGDIGGYYPPPTLISLIEDYISIGTKNIKEIENPNLPTVRYR